MPRELTTEMKERLPADGQDYMDWILFVASKNGWVFRRDDYAQEVHKIQSKNGIKNNLDRIDTSASDLVDMGLARKYPNNRNYSITNLGISVFNSGGVESMNKSNDLLDMDTLTNIFTRISNSISESKATKSVVIALSVVPAIAVSIQAYQSAKQTDLLELSQKQTEQVDTLTQQLMTLKESNKYLLQIKDSLKVEYQKQSMKLDSTYRIINNFKH